MIIFATCEEFNYGQCYFTSSKKKTLCENGIPEGPLVFVTPNLYCSFKKLTLDYAAATLKLTM